MCQIELLSPVLVWSYSYFFCCLWSGCDVPPLQEYTTLFSSHILIFFFLLTPVFLECWSATVLQQGQTTLTS